LIIDCITEHVTIHGTGYNLGNWDGSGFVCSNGKLAVGFQLVMQKKAQSRSWWSSEPEQDKTGLNQIKIFCQQDWVLVSPRDTVVNMSDIEYKSKMFCAVNEQLVGFRLRQKSFDRNIDNTAATNIDMKCSGDNRKAFLYGDGMDDGDWGEWRLCPAGHRIVGLKAQYDFSDVDKLGLTNVNFLCGLPNEGMFIRLAHFFRKLYFRFRKSYTNQIKKY
jgi:hypothetical protein